MSDPAPGASPAKIMNGTNKGGAAARPSVSFNERDHGPAIFGRTPAEHATLHNPKSTIDVDHELLNVTERDLSNAEHTHLISDVLFHRLGRHLCDRVILSGFPARLRYYNHGNYFPSDAFHDVNGHYVLDRALGVYRKEASSTAKKSFHSRVSLSQGAAEGRSRAGGEDVVGAIEKSSATSSGEDGSSANLVQEDGSSEDYNSDAADSHLYLQWESKHLGRWVLHEILHGSHFDHNTGHFNWDEMSENDDRILAIIPDPLFLCFHETPRQIVSEAYWWSERKTFARGMVHVRFCANTFGASTFGGGADVGGAGPPAGSFCVDSVEVQGAQQVRQPMGSKPAYREETARVFLPIEPCGWNSMVLDHFVAGAGAGGGTQVGAAMVGDAEDKKHDTAEAANEDESKKSKAKAAAAGGMINGKKDENEEVVEQVAGGRVLGVEEKVVKEDGILAPEDAVSNLLFTDMARVIVHPTRVKKKRRTTRTASAASAGGEGADEHENDNKQKTKQGDQVDDEDDRGDLVVTLDDYKLSKRYSKEMGCHSFEICNLKWMVEKEEAARREQDALAQVEKTIDHSLDETAANEQAFFSAAAEDFSGKQRHGNAGERLRLVLLETGGSLPACVPFTIRELVKRNRSFVLRSIEEFRMVGAVISVDHAQKPLLDRMIALALHKRGETETTSSRKITSPTSGTTTTTGEQGDRAEENADAATSSPPATSTVLSDVKRAIKQAKTAAAGIQVDNLEKLRPSEMSLVQKLKHCDLIRAVHLSPPLWAFPYISLVGAPAQHFHCNGVYEKVRRLVKKEKLQNILHLYRRRIEHNDHGDAHERFLLVRLDPGNSVLQWRIQKHYSMEDEGRLDAKLLQNLKALDPHPVGTGSTSDGPQIRAVTLLRKGKGSPMSRRQSRLSGRGSIVGDDGTIGLLDIAAAEVAEEDEAKGEEAGAASTSKDNYTERGEILFHATTPQGVELHGRLGLLQLTGAWASKGSEAELRQAAKRRSGSKVDDSPPGGFSPLDRTSGPRGPQSGVTTSRNPPVLLHFGHEMSDDVVVEEVPVPQGQGDTSRNSGTSTSTSTAVRRKSSAELKLEQLKGLRTGPHNRKSTPSASSASSAPERNRRRVFARYDSEDMLGYSMKVIGSGWCDGVYTLVSQWQDASREALLRHWGPDYEYILQLIRDKEKDLHHAAGELKDAETPLLFIRDRVEGHDGVFYPINPLADDENGEDPRAVAAGVGAVDEDGNAQNEVEHGDHSQSLFFLHYDNNTFAGSWIVSRRDVSLSSSDEELVDFLKKHDDKLGVAVAAVVGRGTTGTGIRAKLPPPKGFNRLAGGGGIHIYSDSASGKKTMAGGGLGVAHQTARFSPPRTGGSRSPSSPGGSLSPRNEAVDATSTSLFETVGIVPDPFRYHWKDRHFFAGDADYAGHHYSWELENPEFDLCLGMWRDEHGKWFSTVTELVAVEDADGGG